MLPWEILTWKVCFIKIIFRNRTDSVLRQDEKRLNTLWKQLYFVNILFYVLMIWLMYEIRFNFILVYNKINFIKECDAPNLVLYHNKNDHSDYIYYNARE
jgi:hypothetical protein